MKKIFVLLAMLLGAALVAGGILLPRWMEVRRPNVVFLLVDTLRADRIGAQRNGVPITPWLTQLAHNGVYYENAVSPSNWTRSAMASLFTSLYVDVHRVFRGADEQPDGTFPPSDGLSASMETMPEYLHANGYDMAVYQTNPNLSDEFGFARGFNPARRRFNNDANAEQVTAGAIDLVQGIKEPFFLYAHYMDPHSPYLPPDPYRTIFGPLPDLSSQEAAELKPPLFWDMVYDYADITLGLKPESERKAPPLSEAGIAAIRQLYDGEVHFTDHEVGKLMRYLSKHYPNTLFILVADHGEGLLERGLLGHGTDLSEQQIRVPMILQGPGLTPRVESRLVNTIDMLPTVADFLHLSPNAMWQGKSLFAPRTDEPALFTRVKGPSPRFGLDMECVRQGPMKLIVDHGHGSEMLYNLEKDPGEAENCIGREPKTAQKLHDLLDAHHAENEKRIAQLPEAGKVTLSPEAARQLQDLGYVKPKTGAK